MFYKITYELNKAFAEITFDKSDPTMPKYLDTEVDGLLHSDSRLPRYEMVKGCTPMDLISSSALSGFLILCDRVIDLFKSLHLPLHQYFDLSFVHRNLIYDNYKAFYINRDPKVLEKIDWEKSEFYKTKDWHQSILEKYKFDNWDEMVRFDATFWESEFGFLRNLKIRYDNPYDIIKFHYYGFPPGYICNEKVKVLVEENGFTGFRFEPVEDGIFI